MNLYMLSRTDKVDYDEYAAAVVAADCEETALDQWPGDKKWQSWDKNGRLISLTVKDLKVELIAHHSVFHEPCCVISDYRAG